MQYGSATQNPYATKLFHDQRSAMAPVGIVAVVSMKTIMKKNRAMTLTSSSPCRQKPLVPRTVQPSPMLMPEFSTDKPGPSEAYQPSGTGPLNQLPQPSAKP